MYVQFYNLESEGGNVKANINVLFHTQVVKLTNLPVKNNQFRNALASKKTTNRLHFSFILLAQIVSLSLNSQKPVSLRVICKLFCEFSHEVRDNMVNKNIN